MDEDKEDLNVFTRLIREALLEDDDDADNRVKSETQEN